MSGARTLIGFVDLTLILLGSVALIGDLEQRDTRTVEAIKPEDPADHGELVSVAIVNVFEPGEARLSQRGAAWVNRLATRADGRDVTIVVGLANEKDSARLSVWEQAAARTATIAYALQAAGYPDAKIEPQTPREDADTPKVFISIGE